MQDKFQGPYIEVYRSERNQINMHSFADLTSSSSSSFSPQFPFRWDEAIGLGTSGVQIQSFQPIGPRYGRLPWRWDDPPLHHPVWPADLGCRGCVGRSFFRLRLDCSNRKCAYGATLFRGALARMGCKNAVPTLLRAPLAFWDLCLLVRVRLVMGWAILIMKLWPFASVVPWPHFDAVNC